MRCNWFNNAWCHKVVGLVIISSYFVLLIFVHDTTYVWATLALIIVLFITTFSCASSSSPFILQLRGTRMAGIVNSSFAVGETIEENEEGETQIWMTDIPPSYSFVMAADIVPQTPPPSYGSAIFLFPPPYVAVDANKVEQDSAEQETQQRRPLSISTQVSVSNVQETAQRGVSFATQVSVISAHSQRSPALRARFYISRQLSREDEGEDGPKTDQVISEARGRLLLLAKQVPLEEGAENAGTSGQDSGKLSYRPSITISRQVSREDGVEGGDHHKVKHDLRRRVLLSRQASREDQIDVVRQDIQDDNISVSSQESREELTDATEQPNGEGRTVIILTRQNSRRLTEDTGNPSIEIQACGGCVRINIPEDMEESKDDKNT